MEENTKQLVRKGLFRGLFCFLFVLLVSMECWQCSNVPVCNAQVKMAGPFEFVPSISVRPEWKHFRILVWPYKSDVLRDFSLYRKLGLGGFEIDRGAAQNKKVSFSLEHRFPYYVGHAAGKGILYLTGNRARAVKGKRGLVTRPISLADPETIRELKDRLSKNITTTRKGFALAYAFDDEISLGRFTNPCDVDVSPGSLAWFREWLKREYNGLDHLNNQWDTQFKSFEDIMPKGFEEVRKKLPKLQLSKWNLSPWMDFRQFMDFQFATVLSELTSYANSIDPLTPAGFVGGQGPGPWGGYDYAMLSRAVQWMEAYDINGTNEILRSFWNSDRRPRMQTFFSTKNPKLDSWFLWYYMLHGNQAVIAWPDGWFRTNGYEIAPFVMANKDTFEEIQGPVSEPIVNAQTRFDPDPIAIYYSHPSIQAGWAMDALTHGSTWINRKASIDDENKSKGVLRKVWCKTLEDLGFQYDFISYLDVEEGIVDLSKKFKVIILPKTVCLSDREADALRAFVKQGGTLVADYLCGVLDEHGKGRQKGALDVLFGIMRDESAGYMNGKGLTEIDGERYEQPFLNRFTYYDGAFRYKGIVIFERGTVHRDIAKGTKIGGVSDSLSRPSVLIKNKAGNGQAFYLNLSPIEYWDPEKRFSSYGDEWRSLVSKILQEAGLRPRVIVYENGNSINMIECLYWKNGKKRFLGLVKNPTSQRERQSLGKSCRLEGITGREAMIKLQFPSPVELVNLRTNQHYGMGRVFSDGLKPWEGNLYEVVYSP